MEGHPAKPKAAWPTRCCQPKLFSPAAAAGGEGDENDAKPEAYELHRQITQKLREVERATAVQLRNENVINDAVLRRLELELDLLDVRYD